jgi:hypothetical protein
VYAVKNVKIVNCNIIVNAYGIYMMNTRGCSVVNSFIDASGVGSQRCIAVNNYSPDTKIIGNTLKSDRSCTGILVTQVSDNVLIRDNIFQGSFGGNRAVYVQYLSKATIINNHFNDNTTQNIEIDTGGFALVRSNYFIRDSKNQDHRAVRLQVITDESNYGSIAGVLSESGVIFDNNILDKVCLGVLVDTSNAHTEGNQPTPEFVIFTNNTFLNYDLRSGGAEFPLNVKTGSSMNIINIRFERNVVMPYTTANYNKYIINGTDYIMEATQTYFAAFSVTVSASGGAITASKIAGANFSLAVNRSANNIILSPRSQLGLIRAIVPKIFGLEDDGGATTVAYFTCVPDGTNYILSAYSITGEKIPLSTNEIKFRCIVGPVNNAT